MKRGSLDVTQSGEIRKPVSLKWPFGRKIPKDLVFCLPVVVRVIQLLVGREGGFLNIFSLRTNIAEAVLFCLSRPEVLAFRRAVQLGKALVHWEGTGVRQVRAQK